MAKFFVRCGFSLIPFAFTSSLILCGQSALAKPKSACAQLTPQGKVVCEAVKTDLGALGSVQQCQWIDMSQSFSASGMGQPRKSYCRNSAASITPQQAEELRKRAAASVQ